MTSETKLTLIRSILSDSFDWHETNNDGDGYDRGIISAILSVVDFEEEE